MKKFLLICAILFTVVFVILSFGSFNKNKPTVFKNAVNPSPVQVAGFALGEDVPFLAVNLISLKKKQNMQMEEKLILLEGRHTLFMQMRF